MAIEKAIEINKMISAELNEVADMINFDLASKASATRIGHVFMALFLKELGFNLAQSTRKINEICEVRGIKEVNYKTLQRVIGGK
ncbi:hypothetical protein CN275_00515 [Bacillus anthracis]|nr:hypothetical protein CN275_00515 [Bacillus anthracis]PFR03838.1 hypothetical protein COK10_25115 [Bacillus anthracis]